MDVDTGVACGTATVGGRTATVGKGTVGSPVGGSGDTWKGVGKARSQARRAKSHATISGERGIWGGIAITTGVRLTGDTLSSVC